MGFINYTLHIIQWLFSGRLVSELLLPYCQSTIHILSCTTEIKPELWWALSFSWYGDCKHKRVCLGLSQPRQVSRRLLCFWQFNVYGPIVSLTVKAVLRASFLMAFLGTRMVAGSCEARSGYKRLLNEWHSGSPLLIRQDSQCRSNKAGLQYKHG